MKISNANDKIRDELSFIIDKNLNKGIELNDIVQSLIDDLYELETSNDISSINLREYTISLMYLDALKYSLYIHKCNLASEEQLLLLNKLKEVVSKDDLLAYISSDPSFFKDIILNAYKFIKLDYLSRYIIYRSLSSNENIWINSIINYHSLDMIINSRKLTIDDIKEYLIDITKYQSKNYVDDLSDNNVLMLANFLKNLYKYDNDNSTKLLLEIGKIDYSICKYILMQSQSDILLDHIDYYENYGLDDIIYRMLMDEQFLKDAIWSMYSLYIDKYYDNIEIDEQKLKKIDVEKINKKFNIK